jgi:hypothetical protein
MRAAEKSRRDPRLRLSSQASIRHGVKGGFQSRTVAYSKN